MDCSLDRTRELIDRCRAGNRTAADELFQRYLPTVLKVVRMRMGQRLRGRMESCDLAQDALLHAFQGLDRFEFRHPGSFVHWLAKVVERAVLQAAEHEGAARRTPAREAPPRGIARDMDSTAAVFDPAADTLVPLDKAIVAESRERVGLALDQLPEQYRESIILRNVLGLPYGEIARQTGRPSEDAARMLHAKAMLELGRRMKRGDRKKEEAS